MPESPTPEARRWAVFHRVGRLRRRTLELSDVPPTVGRKDVRSAIDAAGLTPGDGGEPWGNYTWLPEKQWPTGYQDAPTLETMTWAQLERPGTRRVTLELYPQLFNYVKMAALRAGLSMNAWMIRQIEETRPIP